MSSGIAVAPIKRAVPSVDAPPLRISFSWTLAGNAVYSACNWGMITVLAKFGSAAVVGQFALGLAIAAPVFMLTNLQLRGIQVTDSRSDFEFADYFTLRCLATAVGFATVLAVIAASHFDQTTSIVVLLVASGKVVESLSDVVAGLLQKVERLDQVAWSLMIKGSVSMGAFAIVFAMSKSLPGAVAAMVVTWLVVLVTYEFRLARRANGHGAPWVRFEIKTLKQLGLLSLPLGTVMALGSLYTNIPRYVLQHYQGAGSLGILASLTYLGTASTFLINALGQSASTRLSRMFAEKQFDKFQSLLGKFVLLGVGIGVVGIPAGFLFGRYALSLLYRPEYGNYLNVFLVIIATTSVLAVASFLGYGLTAARCFKMQLLAVGSSTVVTALCSLLLVPRSGLMGAALALLFASAVQAAGLAMLLNFTLCRARRANLTSASHSPTF